MSSSGAQGVEMWWVMLTMTTVITALPVYLVVSLGRRREQSRAGWLLRAAEALMVVLLIIAVGRWDIAGLAFPVLLSTLLAMSVAYSAWRHRTRPWLPDRPSVLWHTHVTAAASIALLASALVWLTAAGVPGSGAAALALPFAEGRFIVAQGGGNPLLNYHQGHPAQNYAVDLTALNHWGFRADGLLPESLDRYAIYGAQVTSPCRGEVLSAVDERPDLRPPRTDSTHPAGNHVVLSCGRLKVELAHLQADSIRVAVGDDLRVGEPIGRVGNSGNTTEPHLHIHAVSAASGIGVPITFRDTVPTRGTVFDASNS